MKMSFNIWSIPRESFCWLNATRVIVKSSDSSNGHCELVDIVSFFCLNTTVTVDKRTNTNTTIVVNGSAIRSVAKMQVKFQFSALTCVSSDSDHFVAASGDGSLTLFKNGDALKTVKLPGERPLVRFINGEIVTAAQYGDLTILNEELQILETFQGSHSFLTSLTGNNEYISFGHRNGAVRYYTRVGRSKLHRVSDYSRHLKLKLFTVLSPQSRNNFG